MQFPFLNHGFVKVSQYILSICFKTFTSPRLQIWKLEPFASLSVIASQLSVAKNYFTRSLLYFLSLFIASYFYNNLYFNKRQEERRQIQDSPFFSIRFLISFQRDR